MTSTIKTMAAFCLAFALLSGVGTLASTANAGDYCHEPECAYKTVTTWVSKRVPYEMKVTLYKPCGTPYYAWETYYKTVRFPVTYVVKICH